ncbi:hypothetical protein J2Q11_12335 [Tenacibaculum finnmarkense genomovar finnmarkense]|uniref:hypothetical protein n=1 Tax=Tenacibaculum finnmarkense TaxID=2781243 RepID=UPI001EFAAE6B|nr:hypothetical protein [Tenacibaculum finnmarkense]MCG8213587.1 hypothetical protein [Tenacibaculum finnmarkense genomovar finnmarkense]MCG8231918.1 hypothetical protein [Tenacibaculum finnmarkense genomovar finnmarkense]MCG8886468.1 hypothetical protein [Tenacibaculum finnmarkense]MCG8897250.1 hypothetical protein [Tenacibaculum finnmarkense]MCG8903972.1 hypothetical protein [Tenacibaculum finnmarkense]
MNDLVSNSEEKAVPTQVTIDIPSTEQLGNLKTMETGFNMNPKYRTKEDWFELKGIEVRAYYLGLKDLPNDDGEAVVCAVFATEEEIFFAGQKILVDAVKKLDLKTPVSIVFLDNKKNKSTAGSVMLFEVKLLK